MEFLFFAVVCLGFFSISDGSIICHEGDDWIPYENCLGFYRCVHGSPSAFDCPAGLRFSLILHVCVWPGDAHDNCEGKIVYLFIQAQQPPPLQPPSPPPLLLDFLLTVKAATLLLISGCGSAISSAKERKSGFIYNLVKSL